MEAGGALRKTVIEKVPLSLREPQNMKEYFGISMSKEDEKTCRIFPNEKMKLKLFVSAKSQRSW